jgi:hypothetical protein
MMSAIRIFRDMKNRFGLRAALKFSLHTAVNLFVPFTCLNIIVLDRDRLKALAPVPGMRFSTRRALQEDLDAMRRDPAWGINEQFLRQFADGDICLLSFVNDELAGYTWAHDLGHPELMPGLSISVPSEYVYNYGALTLPKFRGSGLQAFRHRLVLETAEWTGKKGLLGFVVYTNFASQKGQAKSGFRKIGALWLLGHAGNIATWRTGDLRRLGIERIAQPGGEPQAAGIPGP